MLRLAKLIIGLGILGNALQTLALDTLQEVKKEGVVKIGYRSSSPPFSFTGEDKRPQGYAIDICQKVVESLGRQINRSVRIEWVDVSAKTRFDALDSRKIDMECAATTNTRPRLEKYAFANSYYIAGTRIMARKETNWKSTDQLQGKKVAVVVATTGERLAGDLNNRLDTPMQLVKEKSLPEAWELFMRNEVDAVCYDDVLLSEMASNSKKGAAAYIFLGNYLSVEPYAIMMRKNDNAFLKAVNNGLGDVFFSGAIHQIYGKWFLNSKRNIPMSKYLKENILRPDAYPAYP